MKIVLVLICTLAEQFHVHKSYKTRESPLSCNGNFEENIDLSHIHLAVRGKHEALLLYSYDALLLLSSPLNLSKLS